MNFSELFDFIKNGDRLLRPDSCDISIYEMMRQCWELERRYRPTFASILDFLENHYNRKCNTNSFIPLTRDITFSEMTNGQKPQIELELYLDEKCICNPIKNNEIIDPKYKNGYFYPTQPRETNPLLT